MLMMARPSCVRGNGERATATLIRGMQRIIEDLHANLKQLVGICHDGWQLRLAIL
jgi:hypothetical protein